MAGVGIRWCDGGGQCAGPGEATPEPTRVNGSHETTRSSYGDIRSHRSGCCGVGACVVGRGLVERVTGIEPAFSAWEADVLPLNYIRGQGVRLPTGPPDAHWAVGPEDLPGGSRPTKFDLCDPV